MSNRARAATRADARAAAPALAGGCRSLRPGFGWHVRRRMSWGLAAERTAAYETDGGADAFPPSPSSRSSVSSGLPVLEELPGLATVLDRLAVADDALLDAVAGLADLLADDTDTVAARSGVGVEHWLAIVADHTRLDRRLLLAAARLLCRFPSLDRAVRDRRVSFPQLRGLTLALRGVARELDRPVDRLLAAALDGLERFERPDPDVLVRTVRDGLDELDPDDLADRERDAHRGRYLHLQPRLDGTGGRFVGELDAAGLALLDAATTPPVELLDGPGGLGAARADVLLTRLAGSGPLHLDDTGDETDRPGDLGDATGVDLPPVDGGTPPWWEQLAPPKLLLRCSETALTDDRQPVDLLTGLLGGRLRCTSATARRLLDTAGARLRTVVIDDDGTVLGVGRATRRPPGWLTDALAAIHDTCTGPGCDRPAGRAQTDHARPWWPRPDQPTGGTDLDNLGPLCPATNRAKESAGWQATQTAAGTRTWHHPRTGLTTTTIPATWRPPDDPRPRRGRPGRPAPPGPTGTGPPPPAHDPTSADAPVPPDDLDDPF
ncbi:HNH endonuclease [Nitriliruptoraceae bacterium ZYF776]|nr:HNH endonuclease [Profundirhabdus halotolerans]